MNYVLNLVDRQISYDERHVFIDGNMCARYNNYQVVWLANYTVLAKFHHFKDHTWTFTKKYGNGIIEAHDLYKTLQNQSFNKKLGTYTGPHTGALASYIAYMHFLTTTAVQEGTSQQKNVQLKQSITEKQNESLGHSQAVQLEKEIPPQISREKVIPHKDEPKYIPPKQDIPKIEKHYEEPPIYKPPKQEYEYKKPDFTPPPPPIPGGSSEESGGCIGPIAGFAIAIVVLIIAIKMIPQSWEDLGTYIPAGDIGITICFFSSLIGGIIAVLMSLFVKECKFTSCMSAFFTTCGIGIAVNVFILFKDIFAGDYAFTGFILFDLPLAVFAPILGCFQFAFPIGIGVAIICGIICLIKKKS